MSYKIDKVLYKYNATAEYLGSALSYVEDFALIQLSEDASPAVFVQPVCLPKTSKNYWPSSFQQQSDTVPFTLALIPHRNKSGLVAGNGQATSCVKPCDYRIQGRTKECKCRSLPTTCTPLAVIACTLKVNRRNLRSREKTLWFLREIATKIWKFRGHFADQRL